MQLLIPILLDIFFQPFIHLLLLFIDLILKCIRLCFGKLLQFRFYELIKHVFIVLENILMILMDSLLWIISTFNLIVEISFNIILILFDLLYQLFIILIRWMFKRVIAISLVLIKYIVIRVQIGFPTFRKWSLYSFSSNMKETLIMYQIQPQRYPILNHILLTRLEIAQIYLFDLDKLIFTDHSMIIIIYYTRLYFPI